ncbi:hypothetical protein R1flu_024409 [Riccia fluitans]|uniref:Uncharacterized protein n=1 Tax=Riccia fluitans TaxID=41844 RepID=A0ABD1XUZ4_9MARC
MENSIRCSCSYLCKRVSPETGFNVISERSKRRHAQYDTRGILASERVVEWNRVRLQNAQIEIPSLNRDVDHTREASSLQRARYHEPHRSTVWRSAQVLAVHRSFFGTHTIHPSQLDEDVREETPVVRDEDPIDLHISHLDDLDGGSHSCHVVPIVHPYFPSLDEAVYRETWKLQFMLDTCNVSTEAQDSIMKRLFGRRIGCRVVQSTGGHQDFRGVHLGTLLRMAGLQWDGGELGLRSLSSLDSVYKAYSSAGLLEIIRWRLYVGRDGMSHDPLPYGASKQDLYDRWHGESC